MSPQTEEKKDQITISLLKKWGACSDGKEWFVKHYPHGCDDLQLIINELIADDHNSWGEWLFLYCKKYNLFPTEISKGYMNSGDWNSGDRNSGNWNSGDWNSGNWNSGYMNTGDWNSGDRNSGNWNSGDQNTGFFNTKTPEEILVFNKPCRYEIWESAQKPNFILFELTYWVDEKDMTDAEKANDPNFYIRGGQLRTRTYKEAWKHSWDNASPEDKELIKKLPNFDPEAFFELSGIDLR